MGTVKASNLEQAKQLLQSGDAIKLELDFELDSDEFFNFAIEYCTNGTKLTRAGDRFLISRKKRQPESHPCHSQHHRGIRFSHL